MSTRLSVTLAGLSASLILLATTLTTESKAAPPPRPTWEFSVPGGLLVPAGAQRAAIHRGHLTAAQLVYVSHPALALTATTGWARSRDVASPGEPRLDVFTYDLGGELRAPRWNAGGSISFRPFAGLGAGVRSYDYRGPDTDATHNLAAYGSVGGELGIGRVRLRLEAREYVTGFKPLDGEGASDTRNDVVAMAGLRFVAR